MRAFKKKPDIKKGVETGKTVAELLKGINVPLWLKIGITIGAALAAMFFGAEAYAQNNYNAKRVTLDTLRARNSVLGGTGNFNMPYSWTPGTYSTMFVNDTTLHEWIGEHGGTDLGNLSGFIQGDGLGGYIGSTITSIVDNSIESVGSTMTFRPGLSTRFQITSSNIVTYRDFVPVSSGVYNSGIVNARWLNTYQNTARIGTGNSFSSGLTGTFTADRTATFPDKSGTVAFLSDITTTVPGGSGSEIQYRAGASTFGGVPSSSVSGTSVTFGGNVTGNLFAVGNVRLLTTGLTSTGGGDVSLGSTGNLIINNTLLSNSPTLSLGTSLNYFSSAYATNYYMRSTGGFLTGLASTATTGRTATFPDKTGTVAFLDDIQTYTAGNFINISSNVVNVLGVTTTDNSPDLCDASTGGNCATYASAQCITYRLGRNVTVTCGFSDIDVTGMNLANEAFIQGLLYPATGGVSIEYTGAVSMSEVTIPADSWITAVVRPGSSPYVEFQKNIANTTQADLIVDNLSDANPVNLNFTVTYITTTDN
jgi:hypothetical protein